MSSFAQDNSSSWGPSPDGSSLNGQSPYNVSTYAMSPDAQSPYSSFTGTPSQYPQPQQLKSTQRAKKDEKRDKVTSQLRDELFHAFSNLDIPHVPRGPSELRTKLHGSFRDCRDPDHFVREVEKIIKCKLGAPDKELVKQIPHMLAHKYIFEQRMKCSNDGVARPMGWDSIAKMLTAGMGYRYAKGSCETYYNGRMTLRGNMFPLPHANTAHATGSKQPHCPETSAQGKEARQSEGYLTPAQYSTRNRYGYQAGSFAGDATSHTTSSVTTPFEPKVLNNEKSQLSQESLRDAIMFDTTRLNRLLEEEVAFKMQKREPKMKAELEAELKGQFEKNLLELRAQMVVDFEKRYNSGIQERDYLYKNLQETTSLAMDDANKNTGRLETEKAQLCLEMASLKSELKTKENDNKNLHTQLVGTAKTNELLENRLKAYENELSSRRIRPAELDNTPSDPYVDNPPSDIHNPYVAEIVSGNKQPSLPDVWRDSGFYGNEVDDVGDTIDFDSYMDTTGMI